MRGTLQKDWQRGCHPKNKIKFFKFKTAFLMEYLKGVNLSCFEVSQDNGSFIPTFKYDDAHPFR